MNLRLKTLSTATTTNLLMEQNNPKTVKSEVAKIGGEYKALWDIIESFDRQHYFNNTAYQIREVKQIIQALEKFHFKQPEQVTDGLSHGELTKVIDEITKKDFKVDDLTVNILKDKIHRIWKNVSHLNWHDDDYSNRPKNTKFEREDYLNLVEGRDKEGHDKTQENREYFIMDYLHENSETLAKCFNIYLHDEAEQSRHVRLIIDDIQEIIVAHSRGIIGDKQYKIFLDKSLDLMQKGLDSGKHTWNIEEEEEELDQEHRIISNNLDIQRGRTRETTNNSIDCASMNCNEVIALSKKELENLKNGIGIKKHYCPTHKEYDEFGSSNFNDTIEWYTKVLPKTPVLLRWLGVDVEDDDDFHDHIYSRVKTFLKSHKGVILKEERKEYFKYDSNAHYILIKDEKTLEELQKEFSSDFSVNCSSPEILKDGKIPKMEAT